MVPLCRLVAGAPTEQEHPVAFAYPVERQRLTDMRPTALKLRMLLLLRVVLVLITLVLAVGAARAADSSADLWQYVADADRHHQHVSTAG